MKYSTNVTPGTKKDGTAHDLSPHAESNTLAYVPIEPGFYTALVRGVEDKFYYAPFKDIKNPDRPDGKWKYVKLVPELVLFNDNGTVISRQDLILGVQDEKTGAFIRPDNSNDSPIWGGTNGAQFMLVALGLFSPNSDGTYTLNLDTDRLTDRIVRVKVAIGGYIKGKANYRPDELQKLLDNPGATLAEIESAADEFNQYSNETGEDLKLKNVVVGWYAVSQKQANEGGWFYDEPTGHVYATEASFNASQTVKEHVDPDW